MAKLRSLVIVTLTLIAVAAIFFATKADISAMENSSPTETITLEEMAEQSVSYQAALANPQPTLVEFYADWCTTCQGMAPLMQELRQKYGDKINFVMLNVDEPLRQEQLEQYNITGVPEFVFLDSEQELRRTLVGRVPKEILIDELTQLSSASSS